jgi:Arc/MetJ-type ribon-helix-helix transcriptional regulator
LVDSKKRFSVTLTGQYERAMVRLIKTGLYIDHQAVMRDALRRLFRYHWIEPFSEEEETRIARERELDDLRALALLNGD